MGRLFFKISLAFICTSLSFYTHSQTVLQSESFETNGEGTRYTSNHFNTACHDYFERMQDSDIGVRNCVSNTPGSEDGTYYWAGEDCDAATGGEGVITLDTVNVSGYDLDVDILLAVGRANDGRFEPADYLILEYKMDGGSWTIFGALYGNNDVSLNGNLTVDTDLDGAHGPAGAEVNSTSFNNFNFSISATGTEIQIRVRVVASTGTEEILLDNIRLNGTLPSTPVSTSITAQTNNICNGDALGSLTVTAFDGTTPYTYNWSNTATTATISTLGAGTYTVTVTDAGGGTATSTATITEPTALNTTISSQTNVACFGESTGSLTASVTGGTSPYTYNWNSGETSATITGKAAGTYTVSVLDANGCGEGPPP